MPADFRGECNQIRTLLQTLFDKLEALEDGVRTDRYDLPTPPPMSRMLQSDQKRRVVAGVMKARVVVRQAENRLKQIMAAFEGHRQT